jgi:phage replication-related protein YjqB (UPF0714/DUF867 family)
VADKYPNFATLSRNETSGIDFRILVRRAKVAFAIVAPHGGGIEPGTSEIADAIGAESFSFYAFEGLKSSGNKDLHITSTRFDEPICLTTIRESDVVVTIHGEHSEADGEGVFVGGLNEDLGGDLGKELTKKGFEVRKHPNPQLQGTERKNLCNRGKSHSGVQLEISRSVRNEMFESLTRVGRQYTTDRFKEFVETIRSVLEQCAD